MKAIHRNILEQLIDGLAEPVVVAATQSSDNPMVVCNPVFEALAGDIAVLKQPFAEVVEQLFGRSRALEITAAISAREEAAIPVEVGKREFLLVLRPLMSTGKDEADYCAGYLRGANGAPAAVGAEVQQALIDAKQRTRDLSREDPVTGLLSAQAFRDVLDHDWSVARREKSSLALVAFTLDDFDKYVEVFGRHSADSCLRRVAGAVRRCLKRASDVAARIESSRGDKLVVLSHSADEPLVREFATRIANSVRDLGLHHPRSHTGRFITVSYLVTVREAGQEKLNAAEFLESVLN